MKIKDQRELHSILCKDVSRTTVVGESESGGHSDLTNLFIEVLKSLGARCFNDLSDPFWARIWFREVETAMGILRVNEEEKVASAILLLCEKELAWWDPIEKKYPADKVISWSDFKKEFDKKFYPQSYRDEQHQEFVELTQGPFSVRAYEQRFVDRSKFASEMVSTEAMRCRRFEQGLRQDIRDSIAKIKWSDYEQLLEIAVKVEEVLRRKNPVGGKKKKSKKEKSLGDQSVAAPCDEEKDPSGFKVGIRMDNAGVVSNNKGKRKEGSPSIQKFQAKKAKTENVSQPAQRNNQFRAGPRPSGHCQEQQTKRTPVTNGSQVQMPPPCTICKKKHEGKCWVENY